MSKTKWLVNFKTCVAEFVAFGVLFALVFFFGLRGCGKTDNQGSGDTDYDVDELIHAYEQRTNVKLWAYRINLIKSEISEKNPTKDEAEEIINRIASQAPKK